MRPLLQKQVTFLSGSEDDLRMHLMRRYYDLPTTVSMFIGTSKDYVDMYLAAARGMLVSPYWYSISIQHRDQARPCSS